MWGTVLSLEAETAGHLKEASVTNHFQKTPSMGEKPTTHTDSSCLSCVVFNIMGTCWVVERDAFHGSRRLASGNLASAFTSLGKQTGSAYLNSSAHFPGYQESAPTIAACWHSLAAFAPGRQLPDVWSPILGWLSCTDRSFVVPCEVRQVYYACSPFESFQIFILSGHFSRTYCTQKSVFFSTF